jgi:hypothetical protein
VLLLPARKRVAPLSEIIDSAEKFQYATQCTHSRETSKPAHHEEKTMKLAVFGGTSKTGQHIIRQALNADNDVTVLARSPSKLSIQHPKLRIVQGDILDRACVEDVVRGADAVLSVLGPSNNKPEFVISRGIDNVLEAMQKHHIQRIIISAGAGIREPEDKPKPVDRVFGFLARVISRNVVADMQQVVNKVKMSDRAWTIVRVPMLTDGAGQGSLKVGYVGDINPRLSRADLASFMLKQLVDDTYVRKAPAISN